MAVATYPTPKMNNDRLCCPVLLGSLSGDTSSVEGKDADAAILEREVLLLLLLLLLLQLELDLAAVVHLAPLVVGVAVGIAHPVSLAVAARDVDGDPRGDVLMMLEQKAEVAVSAYLTGGDPTHAVSKE